MKRRSLCFFLALILLVTPILSGCGQVPTSALTASVVNTVKATEAPAETEAATEAAEAPAETEAAAEAAEAPAETEAAAEAAEAPAETEAAAEATEAPAEISENAVRPETFDPGTFDPFTVAPAEPTYYEDSEGNLSVEEPKWIDVPNDELPTNDLGEMPVLKEAQKVTAEESSELSRASREYVPTSSIYFVNNAKNFYYYSKLNANAREIYDAMYLLFINPSNCNIVLSALLDYNPDSNQLNIDQLLALSAIRYDHPELFWVFTSAMSPYTLFYNPGERVGKYYPIYLQLNFANKDAERMGLQLSIMADKFLSLVPQKLSTADKVKKVHDLLMWNVTYDHPVAEYSMGRDLAHFAYGALCRNSAGQDFYAVCDGYSLGFLYLLQQMGVDATVVCGSAGSGNNMGGHAWSMVKLGGKWGEYDVTWDDCEDWTQYYSPKIAGYKTIVDSWNNAKYREKVSHAYYNLTTAQINNFKAGKKFNFSSRNYVYSAVGDSQRRRDTPADNAYYGYLMQLAPTAK